MNTIKNAKRLLRVAIFSRVSIAERKSIDGKKMDVDKAMSRYTSCDAQVDMCTDFIKSHKQDGWVLAETYIDDGVSSVASFRPEYDRMMRDVRARKFDIVVAVSWDRLQRDLRDSKNFEELLDINSVQICTIKEGMPKNRAIDSFTRNLLQSTSGQTHF